MNPRRYEIRFYCHGRRLLKDQKTLVGLDLETGHGVQFAQVEMDRLLHRLRNAAGIHPRDTKHCRVEAVDEASGQSVWFYPAPD